MFTFLSVNLVPCTGHSKHLCNLVKTHVSLWEWPAEIALGWGSQDLSTVREKVREWPCFCSGVRGLMANQGSGSLNASEARGMLQNTQMVEALCVHVAFLPNVNLHRTHCFYCSPTGIAGTVSAPCFQVSWKNLSCCLSMSKHCVLQGSLHSPQIKSRYFRYAIFPEWLGVVWAQADGTRVMTEVG